MSEISTDADLLRAYVQQGTESAFAELVTRHAAVAFRSALRQLAHEPHAAEDVAKAAFTLLARQAPRLLDHTSILGWLHTTAQPAA